MSPTIEMPLSAIAQIMDKQERMEGSLDRLEIILSASDRLVSAARGWRDLDFGLFPASARMWERQKAEQAILDALTDYEAALAGEFDPRVRP